MTSRAIVFFTGFQQSDRNRSGLEDLCFEMIREEWFPNVYIYPPRTWTTKIKHLANQLSRQGVDRVAMVSYSHGQAAAIAFAEYAESIGLHVDLWIACDPVSRNKMLPRWNFAQFLAVSALFKKGQIVVPIEINRSVYIRQEKKWPYGHDLIPKNRAVQTVECAWICHTYTHTEIDESKEFKDVVKKELSVWVNPPKAILLCDQ